MYQASIDGETAETTFVLVIGQTTGGNQDTYATSDRRATLNQDQMNAIPC